MKIFVVDTPFCNSYTPSSSNFTKQYSLKVGTAVAVCPADFERAWNDGSIPPNAIDMDVPGSSRLRAHREDRIR